MAHSAKKRQRLALITCAFLHCTKSSRSAELKAKYGLAQAGAIGARLPPPIPCTSVPTLASRCGRHVTLAVAPTSQPRAALVMNEA